jgi:hypothetical protein
VKAFTAASLGKWLGETTSSGGTAYQTLLGGDQAQWDIKEVLHCKLLQSAQVSCSMRGCSVVMGI